MQIEIIHGMMQKKSHQEDKEMYELGSKQRKVKWLLCAEENVICAW